MEEHPKELCKFWKNSTVDPDKLVMFLKTRLVFLR